MQLKLDEQNHVVVQDGKPVFVDESGRDIPVDYAHTVATISRLNAEAKGRREEAESLAEKLKAYEGIEPEEARKALETVKNIKDNKLIESGELDKVRLEAKAAYDHKIEAIEKKYAPVVKERDKYKSDLYNEIIGSAFKGSKFIADKLAIPADLVQAKFVNNFTVENGKVIGLKPDGERIFSRVRAGEIADFNEALEELVENYPYRDTILKGSGASGGGASGIKSIGGKKSMTRAAFDQLAPDAKMAAIKEVAIVE